MGVYLSDMDTPQSATDVFRIGFLLIDGFALMSYTSAVEPLRAANMLAGKTLYDIQHLSSDGSHAVSSSGALIPATALISDQLECDLVLVVAGGDPMDFTNTAVLQWLKQSALRGVQVGGVSGGPVILVKAGIMAQRRMTLHWEHATALAEMAPALLIERSLYVLDRDRLTCAGGTAALDMMHALIANHHGEDFARRVSDWFIHTEVRSSSDPQRAGLSERYHINNPPILAAITAMENHIADPLELSQLAQLVGLGVRQLNRLFQTKLQKSTISFYKNLRLEKARKLLEQTTLSVTDVALATGFVTSAHFSTSFKSKFGVTPISIRS